MARSRQITERRMREVEQAAMRSDANLRRIMQKAGQSAVDGLKAGLAGLAPTIAAAFSAQQVVAYADAWTNGRNALIAAGVATDDLAGKQSQLVDLATETRTSTESTISLYQRLSIAMSELGRSETDTFRLTELLNKSFAASGKSTTEAASAALQLSQALASGVLQGDELRSLRENAPELAQAIAKSMGVSIGELKKLGAEGKITADVVTNAILAAGDSIETKFAATTATVGQALQVLDNELGRYIGQSDASVSASERLAQAIIALSNNLDRIIPVVGALAVVIGSGYAGALAVAGVRTALATVEALRYQAALITLQARQTGATAAQVAFNAVLAANPIGFVVTVIAALSAGLYLLAQRYNTTAVAARALDAVVGAADTALEDYRKAVVAAKNASAEERVELEKKAAALRKVTLARIQDAKVEAQNQINEAVAARQRADAELARSRTTQQTVGSNAGSNAGAALAGGARSRAQGAISLAVRAREEANTALQAYERLKGVMDDIENPAASGGGGGSTADDGKGSKSSGPTPEELARQRAILAAQGQIEILRAQGRTAEADAAQRRVDILNLEKQYADAGFVNAKAMAELQVNTVAQAEAAARGRVTAQERANELLDMAVEAQRRQNDELLDRVSLEAELARLSGDPRRIEQAERDLYIAQRVNELLRDRVGLITEADRQAAERQAGGEYDALYTADLTGRVRDEIVDGLRDGLRSLAEGDVAGFFESVADRFTDRILDNLAEDLADIVMGAFKGQAGGQAGNWLSTIFSVFAGKRATGGSVTAGQPYLVGERRPEVFVPNVNGTVIPSVNAAMNRAQAARSAQVTPVVRLFVEEGAMFAPRVAEVSGPIALQTAATGVSYTQHQARTAAARRRQSFVG
ncbi:MAG: tape measure protein [Brevundimonas sp.]